MPGAFTHSPAKVIRQMLVDASLAVDPSYSTTGEKKYNGNPWPAFYNQMPDDPDGAVQVMDTAGIVTQKIMYSGEMGGTEGIQIMVRGPANDSARLKADAIAVALDPINLREVAISTSRYVVYNVQRSSRVLRLGWDAPTTKRFLFSINALVRMRQRV